MKKFGRGKSRARFVDFGVFWLFKAGDHPLCISDQQVGCIRLDRFSGLRFYLIDESSQVVDHDFILLLVPDQPGLGPVCSTGSYRSVPWRNSLPY